MKNLSEFNSKIEFVLTDIDDTITTEGQLPSVAYDALWRLHDAGLKIIPITGRPAGWCEMIARFWPVEAIVGENGGFYFRYAANKGEKNKKMQRWFFTDESTIAKNKTKLALIEKEILHEVKGSALASDQFCRLMDLAIDFCEDVPPLSSMDVQRIVSIFKQHGAQAKISSIHVNGWFGEYNKLSTTLNLLKTEFFLTHESILKKCIFVGDSPNDESMFEYFPNSFGVANIQDFAAHLNFKPRYICQQRGGEGFAELAAHLLKVKD